MSNDTALLPFVRRALAAILLFGLVGIEVELFLLKHTDGFWQLVPVVLVAATLIVAIVAAVKPSPASLGILRILMGVFLVVGIVGVYQHFAGNVGYEKESNPGLAGAELYKAAAMGSTPLLAPGVMLQLGLIGLLYTYRHPALTRKEL
jgi:hypothetical protein